MRLEWTTTIDTMDFRIHGLLGLCVRNNPNKPEMHAKTTHTANPNPQTRHPIKSSNIQKTKTIPPLSPEWTLEWATTRLLSQSQQNSYTLQIYKHNTSSNQINQNIKKLKITTKTKTTRRAVSKVGRRNREWSTYRIDVQFLQSDHVFASSCRHGALDSTTS